MKTPRDGRFSKAFAVGGSEHPAIVSERGLEVVYATVGAASGMIIIPASLFEKVIAAYQEAKEKAKPEQPERVALSKYMTWNIDAGIWQHERLWVAVYDGAYTCLDPETGEKVSGASDKVQYFAHARGVPTDSEGLAWDWGYYLTDE